MRLEQARVGDTVYAAGELYEMWGGTRGRPIRTGATGIITRVRDSSVFAQFDIGKNEISDESPFHPATLYAGEIHPDLRALIDLIFECGHTCTKIIMMQGSPTVEVLPKGSARLIRVKHHRGQFLVATERLSGIPMTTFGDGCWNMQIVI